MADTCSASWRNPSTRMSVETSGFPLLAPPAEPNPKVVCVLVNWNGWQDTLACLDSLSLQNYTNLTVIVVDNGSTNDSVRQIRESHPWVMLHQLPTNIGFASGCNVGTRMAYHLGADLIWLLNNDTVAPPHTASALVRTAVAHPEAGAIGSVLYFLHDPARVQAWGGGRLNLSSGFTYSHFDAPASFLSGSTYLTGASLVLPRHICESIGIFFEGFFMYCDDSDLCLRIHRAGYSLVVACETAILHKEGGSSPKRSPVIDAFGTTATMRLLQRNARFPIFSIAIYLLLRLLNRLRRFDWTNFKAVIHGARLFWTERDRVFTDRL